MAFLPVAQHILSYQTRSVHNSRKKRAVHFATLGAMSGNFHYSHLMCRNSIYSHYVNTILQIILQKLTKWLPVSCIPFSSCDTCYESYQTPFLSCRMVSIHDTSNNITCYQGYNIHRTLVYASFHGNHLNTPRCYSEVCQLASQL